MSSAAEVAEAEAKQAEAEENVNQKQVELLAARQHAVAEDIDRAENNLRQAEVELLAAQTQLKEAQGKQQTAGGS